MEKLLIRKIWLSMKDRCFNSKNADYSNYGGRGILVAPSWLVFENFYKDMGQRPKGFRLERRDNDKGYSKENCCWATATQQTHNQRIRKDNTIGLKGVTWDKTNQRWFARGVHDKQITFLYQGPDLFVACCARKSWENKIGIS